MAASRLWNLLLAFAVPGEPFQDVGGWHSSSSWVSAQRGQEASPATDNFPSRFEIPKFFRDFLFASLTHRKYCLGWATRYGMSTRPTSMGSKQPLPMAHTRFLPRPAAAPLERFIICRSPGKRTTRHQVRCSCFGRDLRAPCHTSMQPRELRDCRSDNMP